MKCLELVEVMMFSRVSYNPACASFFLCILLYLIWFYFVEMHDNLEQDR